MDGEARDIGRMASNTVLWDERRDTRDIVLRGLAEYARKTAHMSLGWRGMKFPMTWKPYRCSFALTQEGGRREVGEQKLAWLWEKYKKVRSKTWGKFVGKVMEEFEMGGHDLRDTGGSKEEDCRFTGDQDTQRNEHMASLERSQTVRWRENGEMGGCKRR